MCLVPDGDLFAAISAGRAEVVTDRIETFTESGLRLESGRRARGRPDRHRDRAQPAAARRHRASPSTAREITLPETMAYKGMMLSGVPNLAVSIGYTNASWTLKCDLTCEYVCRLLNHMDEHGYAYCTPRNRDPSITEEPFIDFSSGYVQRSIDKFPKQGSRPPWRLHQNYARDILMLRFGAVEDEAMEFSG